MKTAQKPPPFLPWIETSNSRQWCRLYEARYLFRWIDLVEWRFTSWPWFLAEPFLRTTGMKYWSRKMAKVQKYSKNDELIDSSWFKLGQKLLPSVTQILNSQSIKAGKVQKCCKICGKKLNSWLPNWVLHVELICSEEVWKNAFCRRQSQLKTIYSLGKDGLV